MKAKRSAECDARSARRKDKQSYGTWKETARVRRVVEVTEEHIKFETDRIRYCIEFRKDEAGALLAAA